MSTESRTLGASILLDAHSLVTGRRNQDYGHPLDDYTKSCAIFEAMTGLHLTPEQGVLFMKAVKLSRLTNALARGEWHEDSAVDDAGYTACLAMIFYEKDRRVAGHGYKGEVLCD